VTVCIFGCASRLAAPLYQCVLALPRTVTTSHWCSTDFRPEITATSSSSVRRVTPSSSRLSSSASTASGHVTPVVLWTPGRRQASPRRWPSRPPAAVVAARRRPAASRQSTRRRPPSSTSSRCRSPRRRLEASVARRRRRPGSGSGGGGDRTGAEMSFGIWNWKTSRERSSPNSWWRPAGWTRCRRFSTSTISATMLTTPPCECNPSTSTVEICKIKLRVFSVESVEYYSTKCCKI